MDTIHRHNVNSTGAGRVAMLVHGWGTDQTVWRGVADLLARTHRVVAFDHIGSGRSDIGAYTTERYGTLDAYARDVVDLADALELRDAAIIGHSVGGMIAMRAALARPERFTKLVTIGSSPRYLDDPPEYAGGFTRADVDGFLDTMERNYVGWAKALATAAMKGPHRPDLDDEVARLFCAYDPAIARRFAEVTFLSDSRALLPEAELPALIIQSVDDMIVPRSAADYLHRGLRRSTLEIVESRGHFPHLRAPGEIAGLITDFLGERAA